MLSCFFFWSTWFIGPRFELCTGIGCEEPTIYWAFVCTRPGDDGVEGVTAKSDASSSNMFNLVLGGCCIEWNPCRWVDVGIRTSVLTEKVQWDTH